ncbi:hypothetical protein [Solirhodobacter olei]|uniref:hypothetical protein n=1 Tax=Solirhodobacter olei TaxID=2493082 RepID=UPI000FDB6D5B|nr:hypothetical protein [Solirhodobacter olei]
MKPDCEFRLSLRRWRETDPGHTHGQNARLPGQAIFKLGGEPAKAKSGAIRAIQGGHVAN